MVLVSDREADLYDSFANRANGGAGLADVQIWNRRLPILKNTAGDDAIDS